MNPALVVMFMARMLRYEQLVPKYWAARVAWRYLVIMGAKG